MTIILATSLQVRFHYRTPATSEASWFAARSSDTLGEAAAECPNMNDSIAITSGIGHDGSSPATTTMNPQHKTNEERQATGGWRPGPFITPLPPAPAF